MVLSAQRHSRRPLAATRGSQPSGKTDTRLQEESLVVRDEEILEELLVTD